MNCFVVTGLPPSPLKEKSQCGVYNPASEDHWQALSCESALPYICKKTPNDTQTAEPLGKSYRLEEVDCVVCFYCMYDYGSDIHTDYSYSTLHLTYMLTPYELREDSMKNEQ